MIKVTQSSEGGLFYAGVYSTELIVNCRLLSVEDLNPETITEFIKELCKVLEVSGLCSGALTWAYTQLPLERGERVYDNNLPNDIDVTKTFVECLFCTCITTRGTITLHVSKDLERLFLNILFYDNIDEGKVKDLVWSAFKTGNTAFHSQVRH